MHPLPSEFTQLESRIPYLSSVAARSYKWRTRCDGIQFISWNLVYASVAAFFLGGLGFLTATFFEASPFSEALHTLPLPPSDPSAFPLALPLPLGLLRGSGASPLSSISTALWLSRI